MRQINKILPSATKTFIDPYKYYDDLFFVKNYLCVHNIFETMLV